MDPDFSIYFDNFDISTVPYYLPTRRYPNVAPDREAQLYPLVRTDGNIITGTRWSQKVIAVEGFIVAPNRVAYEQSLDILKSKLTRSNRPLVMLQAGAERVYMATLDLLQEEHIEQGKGRITLSFKCADPFGYDVSPITFTNTLENATHAFEHNFQGVVSVIPLITITLTDITDGTNKFVKVGNELTGQSITVTRNWTDGDVLVVDGRSKSVTVNSNPQEYSGIFPEYEIGSKEISYEDDFTDRDGTLKVEYVRRYL